jgi:hypothetical protein
MPLPDGLMTEGGMMVTVKDRPVVLRTFMKDGGSRAIAVGYPLGVHFAFDAVQVRLVDAWRGSFLDASGAWANRGGTNASGQGPTIWNAPAGPALVLGAKPDSWPTKGGSEAGLQFHGYRLNADGSPTFRYSLAPASSAAGTPVEVEEHFQPTTGDKPAVRRTFKVMGLSSGQVLWLNVGDAKNVQPVEASGCTCVLDGKLLRVTAEGDGTVSFGVDITP